jgi:CheY-like chemotaxis protein
MIPVIVIEDQEDAFQTITDYIHDFQRDHRLQEGEIFIERARTYEEWGALLVRYHKEQRLLLIIDIRLPPKDAYEIVRTLAQRDTTIPTEWPIIIYSVVFDNKLRKLNRQNFIFIHKLEDPPDAASPRIKLRTMIFAYLELLL